MALSLRRLLRHETILAALVVATLVVLAAQSERFFTADNLLNQGRLMAEVGLVALTMTFVIVTGGIDLSVGSMLGLSAILVGVFWKNVGLALPVAMVLAVAAGGLAGLLNGFIITRFKVPPLIATLATLALYRGLAEGISQSRSVRGYPEWFYELGRGDAAGVIDRIKDCGSSAACRARAATDATALRGPGPVTVIKLDHSAGFSLGSTLGTARVAWRIGNGLPIVQCVRVRRAGNLLSGLRVELLEISRFDG